MEFRDLKKQYTHLKERVDSAISEVLETGNFISGKQVGELEEQLAEYVGTDYCISCANGTDALSLVLMAWGIKKGDAVFVPDFTFFASGEVVSFEGATPVFYDVDKTTYNADAESLENAIKAVIDKGDLSPKVIITVDLFGLPADYEKMKNIAKKYGLLLLEDGAQGFGGKIGERKVGSFGDAATTSFFPAKPLGCYGDGGAVFTNDKAITEYIRSVCVHGKGSFKYDNVRIGRNSRLDTLQAAILQVKFKAFREYELDAVNQAAAWYTELLGETVKTPSMPEGFYSSWAQYTIQLSDNVERDGLQEYLKEKGIPTMIYYPKPMHEQKAFCDVLQYVECKVTKQLCETVLSLPMHPYLTREECKMVSEHVIEYVENRQM